MDDLELTEEEVRLVLDAIRYFDNRLLELSDEFSECESYHIVGKLEQERSRLFGGSSKLERKYNIRR